MIFKTLPNSSRTAITPVSLEDADDIYQSVKNSLKALREFPATMPWALEEPEKGKTESFCQFAMNAFDAGTDLIYTVRLITSGELVGTIGLHRIDWGNGRFEIGFWCDSRFQGMGLTKESCQVLIAFVQANLPRYSIEAIVDEENTKARRLCDKLNLSLHAVQENARRDPVSGELRSLCVYVLEN